MSSSGLAWEDKKSSLVGWESGPAGEGCDGLAVFCVGKHSAHFRAHFREHWKISREHSRGSLRGDSLVRFTQRKKSTFVGISVDIFVYTPVCVFVTTFVRVRGSNFAVRMLCFSDYKHTSIMLFEKYVQNA